MYKKAIIFFLVLFLVGCNKGIFVGTPRSDTRFTKPTTIDKRDTSPKFVTSHDDKIVDLSKQEDDLELEHEHPATAITQEPDNTPVREVEQAAVREPAPVASKQQHVSIAGYDPFDGGNSFEVNLDQWGEKFCYPVGGKLISPYGARGRSWHSGSDLKGAAGESVYALWDGEVRMSQSYYGYGYLIVIKHSNGLETAYGHNSKNLVTVGQRVKAGDKIALCGRTGRATTEHVHFEVRIGGKAINPSLVLDFSNRCIQSGTLVVKRKGSSITASRQGSGSDGTMRAQRPEVPSTIPATKEAPQQNSTVTAAKAPSTSSTSSASAVYHTITSGDTLYALALRNKTTVKAICALNNMSEKTLLKLGKKLRIK